MALSFSHVRQRNHRQPFELGAVLFLLLLLLRGVTASDTLHTFECRQLSPDQLCLELKLALCQPPLRSTALICRLSWIHSVLILHSLGIAFSVIHDYSAAGAHCLRFGPDIKTIVSPPLDPSSFSSPSTQSAFPSTGKVTLLSTSCPFFLDDAFAPFLTPDDLVCNHVVGFTIFSDAIRRQVFFVLGIVSAAAVSAFRIATSFTST